MGKNFLQEWERVGDILSQHTYLFQSLMEMGKPVFDNSVPTACIRFDRRDGQPLSFHFNEKFWNKLTTYERAFITGHEMLHIILNHGDRGKDSTLDELSNITMDIVVNERMIRYYNFDPDKLPHLTNLCTYESVFEEEPVLPDMNYEYYYSLLLNKVKVIPSGLLVIGGNHDGGGMGMPTLDDISGNIPDDVMDEVKDLRNEKDDKKGQGSGKGRSPTGTGTWMTLNDRVDSTRTTWKEIFKDFMVKYREKPAESEQWIRLHRRLTEMDPSFFIPSDYEEVEVIQPDKIPIWLFMDVSGSCISYKHRFVQAYKSIPKDVFDVRLFSFDTECYEAKVESNGNVTIYGGGGTSFYCVEQKIQDVCSREKKSYPTLVVLFTDGYGGQVFPKHPERWFFCMTVPYAGNSDYGQDLPAKSKWKLLHKIVG